MSPNLNPEIKRFEATEKQGPGVEATRTFEIEPKTEERREQESHAPINEVVEESVYAQATAPVPTAHGVSSRPQALGVKTARVREIEHILSEHIEDLYRRLPEQEKANFRDRGETAAQEIDTLLGQAKVKVKQILQIIISWLSLIPGINKFFIEQQAEIKTNKLLAIKEKEEGRL